MSLIVPSLLNQYGFFHPSRGFFFSTESAENAQMPMDWKETPSAHIFQIDLPGLTKQDVKLQLHQDRILHLTAERKDEEDDDRKKGNRWHCRERPRGICFTRQFRLPENAKVDEIKASMRDGVLTVTVPTLKDESKNKSKSHHHKSSVEISASGDHEPHHAPRGLARFVCCKAGLNHDS